ncbi:AMP-binding enzyme [Gardnerella vaginalis]|uniref:Acyl-CoA synthetase n=1 Tax=Gardnerella vaginalis TaxID=2702 RepID=A0A133P0A5_GARVA|nr:AMP-dependent synthetase/ligase [Gardnerella vaginalis]KXA21959.1 AMP-binding enzyme [Gardnerella vaginalis]
MQEYSRPLDDAIDIDVNVFSLLENRVARNANGSLVEYVDNNGVWQSYTAQDFRDTVIAVAKGFIARGVMPGDAVSIIAHTSWQWTVLDMAIMSIGALAVPIYETSSSLQIQHIVQDSQVVSMFVESSDMLPKIEAVQAECDTLRDVHVMNRGALDACIEYGKAVTDAEFYERMHAVRGSDIATIVYTSGSTGEPKGIELTHSNFAFIAQSGVISMPDIALKGNPRLLLFLPLAHVFARFMQLFCFAGNITLGLTSNLKTVLNDFQTFKPTFILGVPRIFEKIYNAASQKAGRGMKGFIFAYAANVARQWSYAQQSEAMVPPMLALSHAICKKLVYKPLLQVFGGAVSYAISGGAPLDLSIAHFFNGIGLPLLEGYGMTETCAPSMVNPTTGYRIGTVGLPVKGVSVAIANDGELCIKSPAVCKGYHNNPELTRQQIVNGWLHTGDFGSLDADGFVRITGRKKDLIITAGGKNLSPNALEASLMSSPIIAQAVVIGDRKPFIAAIIALDITEVNTWLASRGACQVRSLQEASRNSIVRAEVERAVTRANALVSRAESIRKFEIVSDEFTQANGLITPSLKARRQAVAERYHDLIEHVIYAPRKR